MSEKTVKKTCALAAACLIAAAAACTKSDGGRGAFRFNLRAEPPSLDWSIATDDSSIQVLTNIMEGLTRFNDKLEPVPGLARSWEVLDDGRRYVFHIRENARWTDGRPVTADDFVYSWQRLLAPATAGEYAYFIYMIKNAQAVNMGKLDHSELGAHALDKHTLEVELTRPVVFFPMITAFICTFPMRRDVVEKYGDKWTEPGNIVTCGPFRLVEWRHEYRITLKRNADYHGERPGLDRVVFYMINEDSTALSLYQTDGLDALDNLQPTAIPHYEKDPQYVNFPYFACYYYGFNTKKPPVDNPLVRKALAMSIDRSQLPEILKGAQIPNPSLIPVGLIDADTSQGHAFDPEGARKVLAEAGYPGGKGLPTITIGYNTQESNKMIAEFVQEQWRRNLGISVELRNMEWKVFLSELKLDPPQVWRLGWILDYPDPDAIMSSFLSDSGNNHTRWKSDEFDRLVREASIENDPAKRRAMYDRAQFILCKRDTAIIPLYTYTQNVLIKPWVKGYPENGIKLLDLRRTRMEKRP